MGVLFLPRENLFSSSLKLQRAEKLAAFLSQLPIVQEVYLVGSLAVFGEGNDLDIVVVVDDETAFSGYLVPNYIDCYLKSLEIHIGEVVLNCLGLTTNDVFQMLFGVSLSVFEGTDDGEKRMVEFIDGFAVDISLMPLGWRTDSRVRVLLPSTKTKYLLPDNYADSLCWQAKKFNTVKGHFEDIPGWFGKYLYRCEPINYLIRIMSSVMMRLFYKKPALQNLHTGVEELLKTYAKN